MFASYNSDLGTIEWFKAFKKEIPEISDSVKAFFDLLESDPNVSWINADDFTDFAKGCNIADDNFQKFIETTQKSGKSYSNAKEALAAYKAYLKSTGREAQIASLKTKALSASMKVLSTIGWMAVFSGISWAIGKGIEAVVNHIHAAEKAVEKANDLKSALKSSISEINEQSDSLKSMASRYTELSKKFDAYGKSVNATSEETREYQELVQKLIDLNPTLIKGYDSEGKAIIDKNTALSDTIHLLERERELELEKATSTTNLQTIGAGAVAKKDLLYGNDYVDQFGAYNLDTVSGQAARFGKEAAKIFDEESIKAFYDYTDARPAKENKSWPGMKSMVPDIVPELDIDSYLQHNIETFATNMDEILQKANIDPTSEQAKNLKLYIQEWQTLNKELESLDSGYIDEYIQQIPQLVDGYEQLTNKQRNFISEYIRESFSAEDLSENSTRVKSAIISLVENVSKSPEIQESINQLFSISTKDIPVTDYVDQYKTLIEEIINELNLSEEDADSLRLKLTIDTDDLLKKYENAIQAAQQKFSDADNIQKFFDENSVNTQEEIDNWIKIADACTTANEAKKKYLEASIQPSNKSFEEVFFDTDFSQYRKQLVELQSAGEIDSSVIASNKNYNRLITDTGLIVNDVIEKIKEYTSSLKTWSASIDSIQSSYDTISTAIKTISEQNGAIDLDTMQSLLGLSDAYLASLINEDGQLRINEEMFRAITEAKLNDAEAQVLNQTMMDISAISAGSEQDALRYLEEQEYYLTDALYDKAAAYGEVERAAKRALAAEGISDSAKAKAIQGALDAGKARLAIIDKTRADFASSPISVSYGKSKSGSSGSSSSETEKVIDFSIDRIDKLNDAIELLKTNIDNVAGAANKNTLIDAQYNLYEEMLRNSSDQLDMYQEKASTALAKIPAEFQSKVADGAIDITTFIGDGNKEVIKAIEDYQTWSGKIADTTKKLDELKTTLRQLELDKFNNIIEDFTNRVDISSGTQDLINKQIDLLKESGEIIGDAFYTELKNQSAKQISFLSEEKESLTRQLSEALSSGRITAGTDEWLEMVKALSDVEGKILDSKKALESFDNELQQLHWDVFDRIQNSFDALDSELVNIADIVDGDIALGDNTWTEAGLTKLGMYAQQYELAQYRIQQYSKEIEQLNSDYASGKYSTTEYTDKLLELNGAQWESVNAAESAKDAIVALNEERIKIVTDSINKEIEAMEEATNAKIKELDAEKALNDYRLSLQEKTQDITKIEKQLAAMSLDNTAETVAKRKKLQEELAEKKNDLEKFEYEHSIEAQKDALNQNLEDYTNEKNAEIEQLEESLNNQNELIANSMESVKENASVVAQNLSDLAQQHGIIISDAIITSWQSGETAIASYGAVLTSASSVFIGNLIGVENEVYALRNKSNETATTLSNMFATRSDNLLYQLMASYSSAGTLNTMAMALRNSLSNALEGGYNISNLMNQINTIGSAIDGLSSKLSSLSSSTVNTNQSNTGRLAPGQWYYLDSPNDIHSGTPPMNSTRPIMTSYGLLPGSLSSNKSPSSLADLNYGKLHYAKGTRSAKRGLAITDEEGFEAKLSNNGNGKFTFMESGDQVFTKSATDNLFLWGNINPVEFVKSHMQTPEVPAFDIISNTGALNTVNVKYDNLINIEGNLNADQKTLSEMERIAKRAVENGWKQLNTELSKKGFR